MKRNFAIALLAVSTLAAAGKAVAQDLAVQATVPFEFTVGGKLLPADTYTITFVVRSDHDQERRQPLLGRDDRFAQQPGVGPRQRAGL